MERPHEDAPPPPPRTPQAPTPAATNALEQEALREAAQTRFRPAAQALAGFLRSPAVVGCIAAKGADATNIIDQGAKVPYAMPPATVATLTGLLESMRLDGLAAHFSERQGTPAHPTCGIMLDYDLVVGRADASISERHVHRVASQVVEALHRDLAFPATRGDLAVHVFSIVKPAPVPLETPAGEPARFKYGFHLLVPGVVVSRGYKKYLIRDLRENKAIGAVLADLGVVGDVRECLDAGSASVPVLYVGSCKKGGTPYGLGPAFLVEFEAAPAPFCPMVRTLRAEDLARYNLVAELSLCGAGAAYPDGRPPLVARAACEPRPELAGRVDDLAARTRDGAVGDDELLLAEHALSTLAVHDASARYLHQILDLLDARYYTDRNLWRNVVFALANTSEAYRPLAEWFSHKCPAKWADGGRDALDTVWDSAVAAAGRAGGGAGAGGGARLTDRSLFRWAQECNPEQYRRVSEQAYFTVLTQYVYEYGGALEHYMVAKVLHRMLGTKFVVDVDEGRHGKYSYCWFEFVVPGQAARPGEVWKWRKEVEPDEIQRYLSENLVRVLDQIAVHIEEKKNAAVEETQAKYYKKLGAAFLGSRKKIFNSGFKGGVIEQAGSLFRRRGFVADLDSDPLLLGVGNGVLRLGARCVLIDHFHEHAVLKHTAVMYRPFCDSDPWVRKMLDAVAAIVPEADCREWLMFYMASSLAGGVKAGIILLWYGGGANGKTFLMRMLAETLGSDYAEKLNIGLLTSDRESADKANSAIMQLKGRRWGYVEETQKAEALNTQRLKEIVNPGKISGRDLNQKQESFEVTANLAVGQNYNFRIDCNDHGTWRRIRHYSAKTKFCEHPDPGNPHEKQDDPRFLREYVDDPDCRSAFLGIMVHYYQRLQCEYGGDVKRVPCPTLDRETEAFRNSQDTLNRFISECIVVSPGFGTDYVLTVVSGRYNEWYTANVGRRHYVASEMMQELENSALSKYLRRAPNKAMLLTGCRLLDADSPIPCAGESLLGARAAEPDAPDYTPPVDGWWRGCAYDAAPAPRDVDEFVFVDDSALLYGTAAAAAAAAPAPGCTDAEFETFLAEAAAEPGCRAPPAPRRPAPANTLDNLFGDD